MPFAEQFMVQGIITATQTTTLPTSVAINCGFVPTRVSIFNESGWGYSGANRRILTADWDYNNPQLTKVVNTAGGSAALWNAAVGSSTGISVWDSSLSVLLGPTIAGASITPGAPPTFTTTPDHGLVTGDQVIITNLSALTQIGGMKFTVTVTGAKAFTVPLDTSIGGLSIAGGTFIVRKVIVPPLYYPYNVSLYDIDQASQAVVYTTYNHGLTVGQKVRFRVPTAQGMTQMNNLVGKIVEVTNATTVVVDIDSSAFTAFTWPAAIASAGSFTQAQMVPIGSGPTAVSVPPYWKEDKLDDATANIGFQGFVVGPGLLLAEGATTVGISAGQRLSYTAWRADV